MGVPRRHAQPRREAAAIHPKLHYQLREAGIDPAAGPVDPDAWQRLLDAVGSAYARDAGVEETPRHAPAASPSRAARDGAPFSQDEMRAFARLATENPSPVIVISPTGFLLYANRAAEPLIDEWSTRLGERAPGELRVIVDDAMTSASPINTEVRIGGRILGLLAAADPEREYVCVHGRDITALKAMEEHREVAERRLRKSQEELLLALEAAQMGTWRWDAASGAGQWDEFVQRLFEFLPVERIARLSDFLCHVYPGHQAAVKDIVGSAVAADTPFHFEARVVKPDGSVKWISVRGHPHRGETGEPLGMTGVLQDVTDRKVLESQLMQAQKLESIGQLAAGIAHEINTPTQYIGDNTRFLQDSWRELLGVVEAYRGALLEARVAPLTPARIDACEAAAAAADLDYLVAEVPKAIQQSLEGVARVTKIVSAMKEFSHPGTGEKTHVDINRAIEGTMTVARNEWKYVAEAVTDFDASIPPVLCLPGEFNQVILNIVVNAAHAIADVVGRDAKTKGTITVSTKRIDSWVEIRISDTGGGIPEPIRAKIFDPFFTTKEVGKGTGQGLAIARSVIVDKHAGTIHFETEAGRGTTFIIRLPVGNKEEPPKPPRAEENAA